MKAKLCEICGDPMPDGETMFKYHGYSGPCPKPPLKKTTPAPATAPEQPAWHDAPTCAGWWVRNSHEGIGVYSISEPSIKFLKGSAARWYGPIQPDGEKS